MTEVVGTVVGVVSLGIQVSSAISAYIEGVQCRKEEVESTIRYRRSFQLLLNQIGTLKDNLPTSSVPSTIALDGALKAAGAQILQLDSFMGKVLVQDSSSSSETPASHKFRDQKKKLFYPFRRDQLISLDKRLQAINIAVQSAMQVMELEISMATQVSVRQIHEETSMANTMLLDIKTKFARSIEQNRSHDLAIQNDMDELKSTVEALVSSNSDTMLTIQRLISKPDVLRTVWSGTIDVKSNRPLLQKNTSSDGKVGDEAEDVYTSFYCNCDTRRRLNRKVWRSGPTLLVKEVVDKRPHVPGCPLSVCIDGQNKWTAGFSTGLFRGLVSVAVTITTSTILGASGFSISPSITYFSIRNTSPAREAIHVLGQAFNERKWSGRNSHSLMRRAIKTIQTSFSSRTSSPFDMDSNGRTLLHDVLMIQVNTNSEMPRNEILKFLAMAGVPRDRPDRRGVYPFQAAFGSMFFPQTPTPETIQMLCPDDGLLSLDIQQRRRGLPNWFFLNIHAEIVGTSPKYAELYEGHPSEPIVRRNVPALKHALNCNISLSELATLDAFGNTSLNHLLAWPEGFRLVLDRFGRGVFDASGDALTLDYALLWSGRICTSERSTLCQSDCSCTTGLRLIMNSDVECIAKATSGILWMVSVLQASKRAREMVIGRLKDARQELKEFALLRLAPEEIEKWDLRCSKVLDHHTGSVITALKRRGHVVPRTLATHPEPTEAELWSVYLSLACYHLDAAPVAETFYRHGFCDVDLPDSSGYTPIAYASNPGYVAWLIQHGAKLHLRIPKTVEGHVVAHDVSAHMIGLFESTTAQAFKTIFISMCEHWYLDACVCGCSRGGCNPFTGTWMRLFRRIIPTDQHKSPAHLQSTTENICRITAKVESIKMDSVVFSLACLRACTFELLPLAHTCCRSYHEYGELSVQAHDTEDRLEIRDEDALELHRLEALIEEFEKEFAKMGSSLTTFMQIYWSERMGTVLRELQDHRLSEDEIQNIEMLGVCLQTQDQTSREDEVKDDLSQLDYWYRKLDALV